MNDCPICSHEMLSEKYRNEIGFVEEEYCTCEHCKMYSYEFKYGVSMECVLGHEFCTNYKREYKLSANDEFMRRILIAIGKFVFRAKGSSK